MEWKYADKELPITYKTGNWDGKKSDEVIVEDKQGERFLAVLYSGFIDGSEFNDWYSTISDFELTNIINWCNLPD